MPILKKEIFQRATRMTHRFGENDDPYMPSQYFNMDYPHPAKNTGSKPFNIQTHGLHPYTDALSPVAKFRGGNASLKGPKLDEPDKIAERPPVSSMRRKVTAGAK